MKPSDAASARRDRELSDLKRRVDEGLRVLRRQQRRRLDAPTLADVDEDEDRIKRMIEGTLLLEEVLKRSVPPPDDEGDLVLFSEFVGSHQRATLGCGETMAALALGSELSRTDGAGRRTILADALVSAARPSPGDRD